MSEQDIAVQQVDPLEMPDWDRRVAALPGAGFFHAGVWPRVLRRTYGFTLAYLVATRNEEWLGVLPLMEVRSWLTGIRGAALPFADACAPLAEDRAVLDRMFGCAIAYGHTRGWRHIDLHGGAASLRAPASTSYFGHTLALRSDPASLFAQCDPAVRRAIRKAERSDIRVEFSHAPEHVRIFYRLLRHTRRRHGLPPQPLRFFEEIQRDILAAHRGCVALAYHRDTPIAGAVFFHFGSQALFKFGASDERYQQLRPNNLLMWRAIEWHAAAGFRTFDFGRTSAANDGLRQFKLGWGAREHAIDYVRYDCRTGEFVTETDHSAGWHTTLFRHLPESLSRVIGAAAYKHVA